MKRYVFTVEKECVLVFPDIEVYADNDEIAEDMAEQKTCEMDDDKAELKVYNVTCYEHK